MTDASRPVTAARDEAGRRGRVTGAALAGVGLLLAASTTVWPTKVLAVRVPEVGDFTKGYEERVWSWGRQIVYSSDGVVLDAYAGPDPVGRLVLLCAVLVLAAAAVVTWLLVGGRRGEVAGAAGIALVLATVTASVVDRVTTDDGSAGIQPGLVVVTTTAGWLQVLSVLFLAAALTALLAPALLPGPTATLVERVTALRPASPGRLGLRHGQAVGFSDEGDSDGRIAPDRR